jgi:hypothetical protein
MPGHSRPAPTRAVEPTGEGGMSAKAILPGACILLWLCGAAAADGPQIVRSWQPADATQMKQPPMPPAGVPVAEPLPKPSDSPIAAVTEQPALPAGSVCSPWSGPGGTGCCGPVGGNGPIMSEVYIRNGVVLPVAGGIFNNVTGAGYMLSVGGRSLFFDPIGSKAWTAEFGVDYIYNNGTRDFEEFDIFGMFSSIREHHRAAVHIAGGREYYMLTPAYQNNCNWRVGWDVGGRYGAERVNLNVPTDPPVANAPIGFSRRNDTYGGVFVAFHTDFEYPLAGCRTFVAGLRTEWSYNWSEVIPTWDTNEQDVAIMINFGIKF